MESLPVGPALLDAKGGTMRANPEFERIWGSPWRPRSLTIPFTGACGRPPASRSGLKIGLRKRPNKGRNDCWTVTGDSAL
jgi:hypothetical protein